MHSVALRCTQGLIREGLFESYLGIEQPLVPAPICPDLLPPHLDRDDRQLHAARLEQLEQPETPFAADELAALPRALVALGHCLEYSEPRLEDILDPEPFLGKEAWGVLIHRLFRPRTPAAAPG